MSRLFLDVRKEKCIACSFNSLQPSHLFYTSYKPYRLSITPLVATKMLYRGRMARSCSVCRDPRVDAINTACLEGIGNVQIAQDFGLPIPTIAMHRASGHPSRMLTRAVIEARTGPLSELHSIFIASKANRVQKLNEYLELIDSAIQGRPEGAPVDPKLLKVGVEIIRTAAQELGEWRPDGGEKAEALGKLAQSIVIHAAVEASQSKKPTIDVKPLITSEIIET